MAAALGKKAAAAAAAATAAAAAAEWEPLAPAGLAGLLAPPPNPACTGLSGR